MKPLNFMKHLAITLLIAATLCGCTDYNHDRPDTPSNRKGFARHLGKQPGPDVKGIYFYADELGADCRYQLRFECTQETHDGLVRSLGLTNGTKLEGHLRGQEFPWWRSEVVDSLPVHWKANASDDYYWLLWYDAAKSEAFFMEHSL